ncbi:MAG: hypothetical protein O3B00_07125 [archaeon]|nr:hypothetical protein [archaeon]
MAKKKSDEQKEIDSLKKEIENLKMASIEFDIEKSTLHLNETFELNSSLVAWAGNEDKVKVAERRQFIHEALQIGILAKMQGKVSQTLKLFNNQIDSELSIIQSYMETREYKFRKDSGFKTELEGLIRDELINHVRESEMKDKVTVTGTESEVGTSKKGDVLAVIHTEDGTKNLAIEVKFASSFQIGDKRNVTTKGVRADAGKQVIEQILGSQANRNSEYCLFVIDKSLNPIDLGGRSIVFYPDIKGFIVVVDVESGDFDALKVCYDIARSMTISQQTLDFDYGVFSFLLKDLQETMSRQKHIKDAGRTILETLETNHTTTLKNHEDTMKSVRKTLQLFEGDLAATQKAISEMIRLLDSFFKEGKLEAKEQREMYLKSKENPIFLTAKNQAIEWSLEVSNRHKSERLLTKIKDGNFTEAELNKMKKAELVAIAEEKELVKTGTKPDLIARILG